ncbi:MAG: mandelate racemase/muconate lactonizing enzyme family protein [Ilumatobacteraceae bacterium]|nr:mandelate racemase/muconate lactonizing enzyme family protein [Ilumatobacteraceae bacterium]
MSQIVAIDITHHQLPLDPPFPASWDPQPRTKFPATIVRVRDSDGREGIGSGDVMYGFADYARYFIGQDPLDLGQHAARLANIEFHAGRPWPLDLALWDLAGKIGDEPVWRMLGGTSPRVRLYASSAVHRPVPHMVDTAHRIIDAGFDAMKVRFGRPSIEDDLAVISAVRDAVGDRLTLMVDCNQGWRMPWDTAQPWDLHTATAVAERLQAEQVFWMEEPLHRGDYEGMTELRRRVRSAGSMRIAGGEMTREPYEFRELLQRDCLDVFQPDCVCSQGISGLAMFAHQVAAAGKLFTPHTWGNGIGVAANLQLIAGTVGYEGSQWVEWPYDPPEWSIDRRDYPLSEHLQAEGGWITLSDAPGLGFQLDEERLARTASSVATFQ